MGLLERPWPNSNNSTPFHGAPPSQAQVQEMQGRSRQAERAARRARVAPQETKEWAEAAWWKQDGRQAPPETIESARALNPPGAWCACTLSQRTLHTRLPPVRDGRPPHNAIFLPPSLALPESFFWVQWADHLAAAMEAGPQAPPQPFLPEDLTAAPGSVASALAALAVLGLRMDGEPAAPGGGAAAAGPGYSKVYGAAEGGGMAVAAQAPCLVYARQTARVGGAVGGAGAGAGAAGGVVVAERLYETARPTLQDEETGEEVGGALTRGLERGWGRCRA